MVWPLPPLSGAALVPRGRRGQSDEPAVSALPQDRAGVARDVLDAGPFAAQRAEETAHRIGVFLGRSSLPPALSATNGRGAPQLVDRLHPRPRRLPPRPARRRAVPPPLGSRGAPVLDHALVEQPGRRAPARGVPAPRRDRRARRTDPARSPRSVPASERGVVA